MTRGLRIQGYDLPQVEERSINGPNLPTEAPLSAFGGGEAAAEVTQQAAGLAGDVAKRAEDTYREEYKNGVQLQGLELANQLTAEETRAKNALAQVKGKDAVAARDKTLQDYDKFYEKLTEKVQDPHVKMIAQEHYASRRNTLDAWATPYANGQLEEYDNNELLSSIKNEADSAASDPSPANVAMSVASQKLAIAEFGQRNGRGPDWIKAKQLEAGSSTLLSALKSIVDAGQDLTAKEFFDRNKSEFVGNDVGRAEQLIKAGSSLAEALRVRDTIFSVTHEEVKGKDGNITIKSTVPPITEAEVRDRLNELTKGMEPEARLQAERLSFAQWAQEKQIQESQQRDAFNEADKIIEKPGATTADIPRSLWLSLTPEHRKWLDQRTVDLAKPPRMKDDPDAYLAWKAIPDEDKASLPIETMTIIIHSGKLTDATAEKFMDEWEKLRGKEDRQAFKWKHDDTLKTFQAMQQTGLFGLTGSDRLGTMKGDKNLQVMKFLKDAEAQMTSEARGKPLTQEQKDKVIDQMIKDEGTVEQMTPSWWQYVAPFGTASSNIPAFSPWWGTTGGVEVPEKNKARILKSYPGASESKIQMLYRAEQEGVGPYGLKLIGDRTK